MKEIKCGIVNSFYKDKFNKLVKNLSNEYAYREISHIKGHSVPMISIQELKSAMEHLRNVLYPGYFSNSEIHEGTIEYYTGAKLDKIYMILSEQIKRGFCFFCEDAHECRVYESKAKELTASFMETLVEVRKLLTMDARAAYMGDPAAQSISETIFSYPSIIAMTHHRVAHELYKLKIPLIPRIISEMAHSKTGIDIHPGASIGEFFFIDHGTGTVIGETAIIGRNVTLYQGVTLGAKSFPLDDQGNPIKNIPRHPIVEDDVTIYSGATVLGRVTIGEGTEIGGNVWITEDVPPRSRVVQAEAPARVLNPN